MKLVAHREDLGAGFYTVNVSHTDDKNVTKPLTIEEADALIKFVEGAPDLLDACNDIVHHIDDYGGISKQQAEVDEEVRYSIIGLRQAIERVKP